MVQGSGS